MELGDCGCFINGEEDVLHTLLRCRAGVSDLSLAKVDGLLLDSSDFKERWVAFVRRSDTKKPGLLCYSGPSVAKEIGRYGERETSLTDLDQSNCSPR